MRLLLPLLLLSANAFAAPGTLRSDEIRQCLRDRAQVVVRNDALTPRKAALDRTTAALEARDAQLTAAGRVLANPSAAPKEIQLRDGSSGQPDTRPLDDYLQQRKTDHATRERHNQAVLAHREQLAAHNAAVSAFNADAAALRATADQIDRRCAGASVAPAQLKAAREAIAAESATPK